MDRPSKVHLVSWLIAACIFILTTSATRASAASVYYVTTSGNDGNTCLTPAAPCATIAAALAKASAGDTIKVATGTYSGADDTFIFSTDKDISLSGGWDATFTARTGFATLDGQNTKMGVEIKEGTTVTMTYFIIQHVGQYSGIENMGTLTVDHCIVQDNLGNAISNVYAGLTVTNSTLRNNANIGVYNYSESELLIRNSTISDNLHTGVYIATRMSASIVNSTISGNDNGGIDFHGSVGHTLVLINDTITGNSAVYDGGGIYVYFAAEGQVLMSHTIVYGNTAQEGADCSGTIISQGYNIIGDSLGCGILSTGTDLLDVDPLIGALQDNGGATYTHWLYDGSPAIDGGDPAGCLDQEGLLQTSDQRGFPRPLDGDSDGTAVCDIGAFEADPNNLPPNPNASWYVTPTGKDSNDCRSPANPCLTINAAVGKATAGDTVYVATGVYIALTGNQVVLIDKNLSLSGGWDTAFTSQYSHATVDGQAQRRGITINDAVTVRIENFVVQNGMAYSDVIGFGGGIRTGIGARLTLTDCVVQANTTMPKDDDFESYPYGGGIGMDVNGGLILNHSLVTHNSATSAGGGIHSSSSTLTLNDSVVSYNTAGIGGGIAGSSNGEIILNRSRVSNNTSTNTSLYRGGGGINSTLCDLTVKDSTISGNVAAQNGGGIYGSTITIERSLISYNQSAFGGGIYSTYHMDMRGSAILHNTAVLGSGGGIYNGGDLVILNSTIAGNQALSPTIDPANGGGIFISGGAEIEISNVTMTGNLAEDAGGGIWNDSSTLKLRNTILAENQAALGPDCYEEIFSAGYNLIGTTAGCTYVPNYGDLMNTNPQLAFVYGWPYTFALSAGSPAIDGGNPAGCVDHQDNPILVDQIGTLRPLDGDEDGSAICDIGAYEYDPAHPPRRIFVPVVAR